MKHVFAVLLTVLVASNLAQAAQSSSPGYGATKAPMTSTVIDRTLFPNPYAHIPAQCYIETSAGTQNACQYCHTDGLATRHFGNNTAQAGASSVLGDLQVEYAFAALNHPFVPNGSINPWQNTLFPERLADAVTAAGHDPATWDMETYVRQDNWAAAFAKRPGDPRAWDGGAQDGFRFFPGLDPADLPADTDGFVRSAQADNGYFADGRAWITGWRAVNFVPYGIFTPLTGSVSGIYIRLPDTFMKDADGRYDLQIYTANLDLVARAVQDRVARADPGHYLGAAADIAVEPGLYPLGAEFAHPLHYVDVAADGTPGAPSPFPGTRAKRVKEIRYMYKMHPFDPYYGGPEVKEEDAPARVGVGEGWIDNGAGWILAGFIEDAKGELRPQTPSELVQCVGCHSGAGPQDEIAYADFTSGTGNTIDSTWALVRQLPGDLGWREMDALGYVRDKTAAGPDDVPGHASLGDPMNRGLLKGEYRHFLDTVVGVNLFGVMPESVEDFLKDKIRTTGGYAADWPALDTSSAEAYGAGQRQRRTLLRQFTARNGHLDTQGHLAGVFLYPPRSGALGGAARYRQVVVTQSYDFGKDVFAQTPLTLRYFRTGDTAFTHQDGRPYTLGEPITDRPVDNDPTNFTYGIGVTPTLIGTPQSEAPLRTYTPFVDFPGRE